MLGRFRRAFKLGLIFTCVILLSGVLFAVEPSSVMLTLNQGAVQEGMLSISGTFSGSLDGRQLLLAVYDTEGKMTGLVSLLPGDIALDGGWIKHLPTDENISGIKAFLLDANTKPVTEAQGLHRSGMILKIASAGTYSGYYEEVQVLASVTGEVVFEDMQVRGDLIVTAAQKVVFKGNSMVTGSLKLQKAGGSPTEVILLGNSRINALENTGTAGAVILSLTEAEAAIPTILAKENLQLINISAGTVTLEEGQAQNLKLGISGGEIDRIEAKAQTGVTPTGVTLSVQVAGFTDPVSRLQTEITAQVLASGEFWQGTGETIQDLTAEIPVTAQGISQWGTITTSALFSADATAVIQSLTSSANVEINGALVFGKGVQLTDKEAPDFTLLGSGTTTLTGKIDILTLGGTVTGVLADDQGTEYSVGSVVLQSEASVNPLSSDLNLLGLPIWAPSFTAMPGGSFGSLQTTGAGSLGNLVFMQGPVVPPPMNIGGGLTIGSLQFGNNSYGNLQFGAGSQLGSLVNQSPLQSTLSFPSGTTPSGVFRNYADTNTGSRIRVVIGGQDEEITRNTTLVPISIKSILGPSRFGWVGQRIEDFARNITVELQYRMMNLTTGETSELVIRQLKVLGTPEFSLTPANFTQTGWQEIEVKHIPTGMILKYPVQVYANPDSVLQMTMRPPFVIRDLLTGGGKLAGGEIRGTRVNGEPFAYPLYDGEGKQLGDAICLPSTFSSSMSGTVKITAYYNGGSTSAFIDIGSAATWGPSLRQSALEELNLWRARLDQYIDPDKAELSRIIIWGTDLLNSSASEREILSFIDTLRYQVDHLMKISERQYYNLRLLKGSAIKQIGDYWPVKAGGGTYLITDYSLLNQQRIWTTKEYWASAVESAETEAQINGSTESTGFVAQAKAALDAIPRKGDDLNATLARFGETPSFTLTRSEGTTELEQTALVRAALYKEMLLLGGDPSWVVQVVRNNETNYTLTLSGAESISSEKVVTIQWNIWETRGTVLTELYARIKAEFPNWILATDQQNEALATMMDAVNMTVAEQEAFAFFAYHGLVQGTSKLGTQVEMGPRAWLTRGQYADLLERLEDKWELNLEKVFVDPTLNREQLLASASGDEVEQTNASFVTTIKPLLRVIESYSDLPGGLNDPAVQTIVLQGAINLTAGEQSTKNILVQKNAHLTIMAGYQLMIKDPATLILKGALTNNGLLHIDLDASFVVGQGGVLTNTSPARLVNFGNVLIGDVVNPTVNPYNIEYHTVADKMQVVLGLYQRFKEGYGLLSPTAEDIIEYAAIYADWSEFQSNNPDDLREEAMAWMIKNKGMVGKAVEGSNDILLEPSLRMNRADFAKMLWQFASALPAPLTPVTTSATFSDVVETDNHYLAVTGLAAAGIFERDESGLFRANYLVETTRFNWGSELEGYLDRLVAAAGNVSSEITLIRVNPGTNPVYRNLNFVKPVSVYMMDLPEYTDNWGGEVRFINCNFADSLKINLTDLKYMVQFENVGLLNNEVYTTTPDPAQMVEWGFKASEKMPNPFNVDLRVSLNGLPAGTVVHAGVNTEVTLYQAGSIYLNGAQIQSTGTIQVGQGASAVIWKECEAQHAPDYSGDHSTCVKDITTLPTVPADQYLVLEVRDQVSQVTLPTPSLEVGASNFGRIVMNESCPEVRLNFGIYDAVPSIFRINGGRQNTLILNGSLTGNLEVVGHTDLRDLTVTGTIDIGTWWEQTAVNIGSHSVRLLGHGNNPIALTADNGAVVLVTESGQPYTINYVSDADRGFQIGLPHVYGNQGDCGVYIGTANITDYDFVVSQGTWNEETQQKVYSPVATTEQAFDGENKTHLTPVNQNDVTDYNQLALSTTWRNGEKTITVLLRQIPIKINYLNRRSFAMSLYGEFRNVYGLSDATTEELNTMSTTYSDWSSLSVEEKSAIAFMLKHRLLPEIVEGDLKYVKPQEQVSRGQTAQTLYALANALELAGTYPEGLNLSIAPNATFNDLPIGDLGTAIQSLAKAGVFSPDNAGFRPSEILNDRDLRDWIWRLIQNLGPAVSLETSFEVFYGQEVRVENKVFSQEVKVFSDRLFDLSKGPWSPENQGGQIRFINCDFQAGLVLHLGEVGYQVSFENVQLKDQKLSVYKHTTLIPNPYLPEVQVQIHGVPSGTIVDSTVNVSVSSNQVGYFVLNGIRVDSATISTQEPPQDWSYQAGITYECRAWHAPNLIVDHANCKQDPNDPNSPPAQQFNMIEFNGQIASVTPLVEQVTKYSSIAKYQVRDIKTGAPVEFHITNIQPTIGQLYIQADTVALCAWSVIGSALCNTEVTGFADLTQFECQGLISLNNWFPQDGQAAQIFMAGQAVVLTGDNAKEIRITAGQGARIYNNNNLKMTLFSRILEQEYDITDYHVFGEDGNYGVYLDSLLPSSSGTYTITLEKPVRSQTGEITSWIGIPYTLDKITSEFKTHLIPVDPQAIEDPWEVRMTVTWVSGTETITVINEFLPYQQPLVNQVALARTILATYTENIDKGTISEYGLLIPTHDERLAYETQYTDYKALETDGEAYEGVALLLKNQLIQPVADLLNPWTSMNRTEVAVVLYRLVRLLETALNKTISKTNDAATYQDITTGHPNYTEISYLLQRGILPGDWQWFEPDTGATQGDLWDWNRRLQDAFGKLVSNRTEITLGGGDVTISNRIFTAPVTISTTMTKNVNEPLSNHVENWGGRLELPQCEFQQGLTIILNEVPFEVSMMGSPVTDNRETGIPEPGVIYVQATDTGLGWKFDPDWILNLSGVASGTVVTCEGNVSVTSGEPNAQFNLQGNLIVGNATMQPGDYFGANLSWICDDFNQHGDTNIHNLCNPMYQHQMLGFHGLVKEVQAGVQVPQTMKYVQTFELWRTNQDVELKFPTVEPYPLDITFDLSIGGWSETAAFLRVSGWVDNHVNVWGQVDVSNLSVEIPDQFREMRVLTYRPGANVVIGAKTVSLEGPEGSAVTLQAGQGAVIDARNAWSGIEISLKDMSGSPIPYDVSRVNWNKTPEEEWVIIINSVDENLVYQLYNEDQNSNLTPLDFQKILITKEGDSAPSLTALVPVTPLHPMLSSVQVTIQKNGISILRWPYLEITPDLIGSYVSNYDDLLSESRETTDFPIFLTQSISLPVAPAEGWSLQLNRHLVISENVTLTIPAGAKMAFKSIDGEGNMVVEGASETLNSGYIQGGNITGGITVSGGGSVSVSVDEAGLRSALEFTAVTDISIDKPLALSGTLSLMRTEQQPPRRIFLFAALTALQENSALTLYQGDLLKNEIVSGHNFYETDEITPIPNVYNVTDPMRVFHWKATSSKWIADFNEGMGTPELPMPT